MYGLDPSTREGENIFYYLTIYNEPYLAAGGAGQLPGRRRRPRAGHPARALPVRGRAASRPGNGDAPAAQILASGVAVRWALEAQQLLADDWGVAADVWSATSWTELRRDALACEEWNLLHPDGEQRVPYVTQALDGQPGPVVAVSDWMRAVPDQIARWVPGDVQLARHRRFRPLRHPRRRPPLLPRRRGVDHVAVLTQLARRGEVKPEALGQAIEKYRLDVPVSALFASEG